MRIVLLYPPPWKIPAAGEAVDPVQGPPDGFQSSDLDPDFYQMPYGLLSLAAQALRAGHQVKLLNLSSYTWTRTEEVLRALRADLVGMSCWTANRRGVALAASVIKAVDASTHVVIGGPHATPLASDMLDHYPQIDSVCVGESELTFLELIDRLERGASLRGLAGAVYRTDAGIERGPERAAIHDLDTLASPHEYFDTHIVMTSRGCPWACTFCGAETSWGRGFRGQSVPYVLDALGHAVRRAPVKMLQIKDDTFTTNKKRVLELCQGIRERNLNFYWSCDTRVDVLSDELLREMRLAGCQRLSLGVESGSREILSKINKKITVEKILNSTELAKKYGIQVRYYMMLGNRGETADTFRETLQFLKRAAPHQYIFACLSIYPGTQDFQEAEAQGWLDRELYFTEKFQELKVPFDASEADTQLMVEWFSQNSGLRDFYREGVPECLGILERLGDYHGAHLDLGGAYYKAGQLDAAERHIQRAIELGTPIPGIAYNYLACIAYARGELTAMQDLFMKAARLDPQHFVLIQNVRRAREWFAANGATKRLPLELVAHHDFQLLERTLQPSLPGPLSDDFALWPDAATAAARVSGAPVILGQGNRLPVVRQ